MSHNAVSARQSLLAKLQRLSLPKPEVAASHPVAVPANDTPHIPPSRGATIDDLTLERLSKALQLLGGEFYSIPTMEDLPAAVVQLARENHFKRLAIGNDPVLSDSGLLEHLRNFQDFRWLLNEKEGVPGGHLIRALAQCHLGITGCEGIIADTATVVLSHKRFGGRSISLLPECHAVVALRTQVFASLDDWMDSQLPHLSSLPSCLTFVTGPSRTADIEKILITGVHGPLRLVLFLVG